MEFYYVCNLEGLACDSGYVSTNKVLEELAVDFRFGPSLIFEDLEIKGDVVRVGLYTNREELRNTLIRMTLSQALSKFRAGRSEDPLVLGRSQTQLALKLVDS